jgi:hypothetical protein
VLLQTALSLVAALLQCSAGQLPKGVLQDLSAWHHPLLLLVFDRHVVFDRQLVFD